MILWLTSELLKRGHQVAIFTSEYDKHDNDIPQAVRGCIVEVYAAGGNYSTCVDWMLTGFRLRKRLQNFDVVNPHNFPANVWLYFAKLFSRSFPKIIWYCQEPSRLLYEQNTQVQKGRYNSVKTHLVAKFRQDGWKIFLKLFQKSVFYLLNTLFKTPLKTFHISLDQRAVRSCDLMLANSNYIRSKIQKIYNRQAITCYQGSPIRGSSAIHVSAKKEYFLTVSRLEPLKHVDSIIKAINILVNHRDLKNVSLVIIGKGTQESSLKELVVQLDLKQYISFSGYISDNDLHRHYREALAVIYISEDEPFGLVPLEAMLHKTAVIVSNEGGMLETVVNNSTGIHVEPRNVEHIADAMTTLLCNRQLALEMGEKGHQHVMENFTFSNYVDRFEYYVNFVLRNRS